MKNVSRILWGIIIVVVGVIIGLNALGYTNINVFFDGWWTLFIIVPSLVGLFTAKDITGNLIGLLIGSTLLLSCQDIISFKNIWKLIVPVALIIFGLSIIFKDSISRKIKNEMSKLNKNKSEKSYCSTFASQKIDLSQEKFDGCTLDAIFGGIEIDLSEAIIKDDIIIEATTVFGGIDILAPKDVIVKVSSTPIFGGVDNKHNNKKDDKCKTIYINATCIFGGVSIK